MLFYYPLASQSTGRRPARARPAGAEPREPGLPGPAPRARPPVLAPPLFPAARGSRDHPGPRLGPRLGGCSYLARPSVREPSAGAPPPRPRRRSCPSPPPAPLASCCLRRSFPSFPGSFLLTFRWSVPATFPPGSLPSGPSLRQLLRLFPA